MTRFKTSIKSSLLAAAVIGGLVLPPLSAEDVNAMTLKEVLVKAYDFNPVLKSERESLQATDERVSQAVSEWRPTVTAAYTKGRQQISFGGADEENTDKATRSLSIEQPIFDGMGSMARLSSAKLQVMAGRATLLQAMQDVLLQAITAYMDVVRDTAVLDLSKNNVGVLDKQLKASKDRFDVGEVTRTDVAQSEARLSRALSESAQAEGALVSSKAQFKRVVGEEANNLHVVRKTPEVPASLDEAIEVAMDYSPILKQAEYSERALEKEVKANVAGIMPSVSLTGSMRREEGAGVSGGSEFDNDVVTLNVSVPLYQSGAEYSRVREAKQRRQEAKYDTMDARNQTVERVTRAWQSLETSRASIKANRDAIKAAEVALDGVKQEQQYGARTVLDVLDAEQELFAARVNLVRSERNEMVAAYTLLSVMGKLTPKDLGMDVTMYDPEDNYDRVKYKPLGF